MIDAFRLLLAQNLVHLFEGVTFGDWVRMLRRERFRVDPICWPRALWITGMSLGSSIAARAVERRFGAAIEAARVEALVFILGHYRSGTTHLHELMALDPRYASPTRFQAFNPRTFLGTERWLAPAVEPFMLPRRVQEDEVALMSLTGLSPYMDWCFPLSRSGYGRYLTFRDADPAEAAAWSAAMSYFLKALTLATGRPLILKSPPHTARVRLLLALFPDARFVHIRRDPYAVFVSTVGLLKAVKPVFRLQLGRRGVDTEYVLRTYADMYDAYFDDRAAIPRASWSRSRTRTWTATPSASSARSTTAWRSAISRPSAPRSRPISPRSPATRRTAIRSSTTRPAAGSPKPAHAASTPGATRGDLRPRGRTRAAS